MAKGTICPTNFCRTFMKAAAVLADIITLYGILIILEPKYHLELWMQYSEMKIRLSITEQSVYIADLMTSIIFYTLLLEAMNSVWNLEPPSPQNWKLSLQLIVKNNFFLIIHNKLLRNQEKMQSAVCMLLFLFFWFHQCLVLVYKINYYNNQRQ